MIFKRGLRLAVSRLLGFAIFFGVLLVLNFLALVLNVPLLSSAVGFLNANVWLLIITGLFLFLVYEKIRGRPPSIAFQNAAALIGLALIGTLFVVTFFNDVLRLTGGG